MRFRAGKRSMAAFVLVLAGIGGLARPGAAQGVPNDNCSGAWPLDLGQTPGTNEGSTTSPGAVSCSLIGSDVWYSFLSPGNGLLKISTVPGLVTAGVGDEGSTPPIDSVLALYSGACGALVPLACNDDASLFTLQSEVNLFVTTGQKLFVRVGGFLGESGNFVLTVSLDDVMPIANDDCSGAILVTTPTISGTTEPAFTDTDSGSCTLAGKNVWYAYAASASGQLTASLLHNGGSASFDTALAVFTGSCGALQQVACNDDFNASAGQFTSEVKLSVTLGELYYISVGGFLGDSGDFTLSLKLDPQTEAPFVNPVNGHTYLLGPPGSTWSQARDFAQSVGGHLATFGDFFESILVQSHFIGGASPLWIGLGDEGHEGSFAWVTGEPFTYSNWQAGQPDNNCSGAAENSVAMIPSSGLWIDTTESGCMQGLLRGLIEFEGPVSAASLSSVGKGCAPGAPPVLLASLPVLGQEMALTVLDPGMTSLGVILASAMPRATTIVGRCTIHVDLPSSAVIAEIATDAMGVSTTTATVPANPALVGMTFAVQAFLIRASDHSTAATNGMHMVVGF